MKKKTQAIKPIKTESVEIIPADSKLVPTNNSVFLVENVKQRIQIAKDIAKELFKIVEEKQLYITVSKRIFVNVEGWICMLSMFPNPVHPHIVESREHPTEKGRFLAKVELITSNGKVVGDGEGECEQYEGKGKKVYSKKQKKYYISQGKFTERNQARSMAITRATGKACRLNFGWIMVLAGFSPTPAEEIDKEDIEAQDNIKGGEETPRKEENGDKGKNAVDTPKTRDNEEGYINPLEEENTPLESDLPPKDEPREVFEARERVKEALREVYERHNIVTGGGRDAYFKLALYNAKGKRHNYTCINEVDNEEELKVLEKYIKEVNETERKGK